MAPGWLPAQGLLQVQGWKPPQETPSLGLAAQQAQAPQVRVPAQEPPVQRPQQPPTPWLPPEQSVPPELLRERPPLPQAWQAQHPSLVPPERALANRQPSQQRPPDRQR